MDPQMQALQNGIEDRQKELRALVPILGRHAFNLQRMSNWLRVATILLSAVGSAKGVADTIYGHDNMAVLATFTLIGIVTTVTLGIEAAFKFEKRAADINMLAASCQGTVIEVDSAWRRNIGSYHDSDLRGAARDILTMQDAKLAEIHQKAAALGLNITLDVRRLEDPQDIPYAA